MNCNIDTSTLFKMPLWDGEDTIQFVFRFSIFFLILLVIVRYFYYESSKRKDYLFTYILISTIIFLLCFILESVKLELGMALGLFAVFGIIRYRTSQIPIREMTYLFVVIGVAVINALSNKKISLMELTMANGVIILIIWFLERGWALKHVSRKVIQYDKIKLIHPDNYEALKEDLRVRLGLDITKIEVGKVDFLRDTAKLVVYYNSRNESSNIADDLEQYSSDNDDD